MVKYPCYKKEGKINMKKIKAVSLLLAASMVISMTGCSGAKKQILEAADEYAKAILAADAGDIADLMKDDDESEEILEAFFDRYSSNEDLEDVYEFILENTTYKIDKKSVEVKDKKASATITFTMIDYMDVYDGLDDDADVDDYLDELEENKDNTCEFDLKVEFKLDKDEWKIVDKDNEDLLEFYGFYPEIMELGLAGLPYLSLSEFEDAVAACTDIDIDYFSSFEGSGCTYNYCTEGAVQYLYYEYDDEDDARDEFEEAIEDMEDPDDDDVNGTYVTYYDGTCGYILVDGEFEGEFLYGGIYLNEDVVIVVVAYDGNSGDDRDVDAVLDAIGYPKP